MARADNQLIFWNTQSILKSGFYYKDGKQTALKLSQKEMQTCRVYLPDEVEAIKSRTDFVHSKSQKRCVYGCYNKDSFAMAIERLHDGSHNSRQEILVLNLANPVNPGGGVLKGSKAQEEDLCRRSTLSASLFSETAEAYYQYNGSLETYMGSDAIIITPKVEIIKDEKGEILDQTEIVAVMTCAAPMLTYGMEGMTDKEYQEMVYNRIEGMLKLAAYLGYRELVLGAFGCGAFGNDARIVSDLFCRAFRTFSYDGLNDSDCFDRVDFAVLSKDGYNYQEFLRNFGNFYKKESETEAQKREQKTQNREQYRDAIRGSLIGGAAGDALGYPVEFMSENAIWNRYGEGGIREYELDRSTGKAVISDDTQMTLFTANGILFAETRYKMRGIKAEPRVYVEEAYQDWLSTQKMPFQVFQSLPRDNYASGISWLMDVPELFALRAPGNTCLSALEAANQQEPVQDYIHHPRNNSKGCGGVMRVAPVAMRLEPGIHYPIQNMDWEAAQIAAITHGHSLGYMPAAVLAHIISRIIFAREKFRSIKEIVLEARDYTKRLFERDAHIQTLCEGIDLAVKLAENREDDLSNIHRLGKGWVAEETLWIAIYCAVRYQDDFSKGIMVSVNHEGDSDSTGAVTGNMLGAWAGYEAMEEKWKTDLELKDTILEMADDLCFGCRMRENGSYYDPAWVRKYIEGRKYQKPKSYTFFWKEDESNGCFSNWYPSPFTFDGISYKNVEQFMMAEKARLFGDDLIERAILNAETPSDCKQLGRRVRGFDSARWDAVKANVVKTGNREKFMQNPELKQKLRETGESILAEASPKDRIWGISVEADIAGTMDPKEWPGQNQLGKILMELRDEMQ